MKLSNRIYFESNADTNYKQQEGVERKPGKKNGAFSKMIQILKGPTEDDLYILDRQDDEVSKNYRDNSESINDDVNETDISITVSVQPQKKDSDISIESLAQYIAQRKLSYDDIKNDPQYRKIIEELMSFAQKQQDMERHKLEVLQHIKNAERHLEQLKSMRDNLEQNIGAINLNQTKDKLDKLQEENIESIKSAKLLYQTIVNDITKSNQQYNDFVQKLIALGINENLIINDLQNISNLPIDIANNKPLNHKKNLQNIDDHKAEIDIDINSNQTSISNEPSINREMPVTKANNFDVNVGENNNAVDFANKILDDEGNNDNAFHNKNETISENNETENNNSDTNQTLANIKTGNERTSNIKTDAMNRFSIDNTDEKKNGSINGPNENVGDGIKNDLDNTKHQDEMMTNNTINTAGDKKYFINFIDKAKSAYNYIMQPIKNDQNRNKSKDDQQ